MVYFCILMQVLIAASSYLYKRDGLSPAVIQPLLWAVILIGAEPIQERFFDLSIQTLSLCVIGSLLFVLGFWLSIKIAPRSKSYTRTVKEKDTLFFRNSLFFIVLLILPFYAKVAYSMASSGPMDDLAFNLRYNLSEGQDDGYGYGIAAYGVTLSLFLVLLESTFYNQKRKLRFAIAILMALIFCVLSTGRTFILFLLICLFFPLMLNERLRVGRGIALILGIFLPAFYVYSVTLGKDGGGGWDSMVDVFAVYLYGGLFAFDKLTHTLAQYDYGGNLFRVLYAIAHAIDPSVHVTSIMEDYQYLPAATNEYLPTVTNVYTVYGKAYRDFGYIGVVVYMFVIGIVHGYIYFGAKRGSIYFKVAFALSFFPLLMQFFQDQYMGIFSTWVQLFLLTILFMIFTQGLKFSPRLAY